MNTRLPKILALLFVCSIAASCAQGAAAIPADAAIASPINTMTNPVCGNGIKEMGETCECQPNTQGTCAVTTNDTCETLNEGTGVLLCNASLCVFEVMHCSKGMAGSGGSGTGG